MIAITRLAIFCAEKYKTSKTCTATGAQHFLKYKQMDWQSYRIKVGQTKGALNEKLIATKIFLFR